MASCFQATADRENLNNQYNLTRINSISTQAKPVSPNRNKPNPCLPNAIQSNPHQDNTNHPNLTRTTQPNPMHSALGPPATRLRSPCHFFPQSWRHVSPSRRLHKTREVPPWRLPGLARGDHDDVTMGCLARVRLTNYGVEVMLTLAHDADAPRVPRGNPRDTKRLHGAYQGCP